MPLQVAVEAIFFHEKITGSNLGFTPQANYCMSRPKPVILDEVHKEWFIEQVLLRETQWLLTYNGSLVSMKSWNNMSPNQHVKYMKTNWSDESRARTMCVKLNARYGTDAFGYVQIGLLDQQDSKCNNSTSQP